MAGQAAARDADREVHDCLTATEAPDRDVAHSPGQESEVFRGGRHDPRELGRQALRLPEHGPGAARVARGGQVPKAPAFRQPVGPFRLLMYGVSTRVASCVVCQEGARDSLGPARLPVLGPVTDVYDPEQVAPSGGLVYAHQQLSEEQVLLRRRPEQGLEHIAPEQPPPGMAGQSSRAIIAVHVVKHRSYGWCATGPASGPAWSASSGQAAARGV